MMPQENLRKNPLYRAEDLGKRIPDTTHAISMCLPRWQDVIGYEERDPATMDRLELGYPRFYYHPFVEQAFARFCPDEDKAAQIYSSRAAAERAATYIQHKHPGAPVELRAIDSSPCMLVAYPPDCAGSAKEYWQHAGEGISSRCAEALLNGNTLPDASDAEKTIRHRLATFLGTEAEHIYLFNSGMSAINAAFLAVQRIHPDRPSVQFAFPYGDTLKLQERMGAQKALFYSNGHEEDVLALETELKGTRINSLFCEFPTNPLLTSVNLPRLRELADAHQFPIIIDETLGACINQNTLPLSDVTAISLTKFFSGTSDVMGGALIVNPHRAFAAQFNEQLKTIHVPEAFHPADLIQLEKDSRCCRERVEKINASAQAVCAYLHRHPAVEAVYYPSITDQAMYDRFRRAEGGYGGLFSFVLKDAAKTTAAFYDALEITKGPNLGTSFSLCCPFTLIAHYDELEWAEAAGASRWLIRISTGTEPAEELIARLERALP